MPRYLVLPAVRIRAYPARLPAGSLNILGRRTCDAATPPISAADFSGRQIPVNAGLWPPPPAACGVDRDPSLRTLAAKSSRQNLCQFSAPRRISADSDRRPHQATLALHLVTRHGRATPLLWLSVDKDELKNQRNDFEDLCLSWLKALLPEGVVVTILADRGFGDVKLFEFLESLGFRYVIRFRGDIHVSAADGETRPAADWVGKGGRARKLSNAEVTAARHKVGAVVCVKAAGMKDPWHLAASDGALSAPQIVKLYAKRWTIEPSFRDSKDLRFGMGMGALRIAVPQRRDRLLLLNAFAILLLTILGAAGESLGMD